MDPSSGYRFRNLSSEGNSDGLFVILTFSGGGHRAAAFAYGVLKRLRDDTIEWEGRSRRLLDEVDVISSVSGGSFTAAYYGLYRDRVFEEFEDRFLHRNIQGLLVRMMFNPVNWFRLPSPRLDRIDLAAELYDRRIFDGKTFGDLAALGNRPIIVINATDMTLGARFGFTQEQFDLLCSNLSSYPIARAVAASSAFPIALSPITLINHSKEGCDRAEPAWLETASQDFDENKRRFNRAQQVRSYLDGERRPFIHLLDGGVSDNIGLRGPLDEILSEDVLTADANRRDTGWNVSRLMNEGKIRKLVVIAVNAKKGGAADWDTRRGAPRAGSVRKLILGAPMGNYSFETIERMREKLLEMESEERCLEDCQMRIATYDPNSTLLEERLAHVDFYPIEVGFDALKPKEREEFMSLPTSFDLTDEQVRRLEEAGGSLLSSSPVYAELLGELRPGTR